ncbi:phospholipase [Pedobacter sp. HMF7647]|uniref:Phospholipase n=1 Tax=Hufsiella arboris TaxID=2695275 RepID=A0A7K1Y9N0_9SPHI|nr:dienelactone hydrolase family protein [Hufsiella arboris]MXV51284.1 phospholipase [Hufsiella arboris]
MHKKKIKYAGLPLDGAGKVLIMLHGRGASADDILSLSNYLNVKDFALIAPQATNQTWYPYSFLAPAKQNEPWLSSAMDLLSDLVSEIEQLGITKENLYFLGFSQGACLTLEFASRNAAKYGGIVAFTGSLIGEKIEPDKYKGDFEGTPVLIATSNPDFHVPVERVYASANILKNMGAHVTEKVYDNMGHTINQDEINLANQLIFDK